MFACAVFAPLPLSLSQKPLTVKLFGSPQMLLEILLPRAQLQLGLFVVREPEVPVEQRAAP